MENRVKYMKRALEKMRKESTDRDEENERLKTTNDQSVKLRMSIEKRLAKQKRLLKNAQD